jgi:hypothetical protein
MEIMDFPHVFYYGQNAFGADGRCVKNPATLDNNINNYGVF